LSASKVKNKGNPKLVVCWKFKYKGKIEKTVRNMIKGRLTPAAGRSRAGYRITGL